MSIKKINSEELKEKRAFIPLSDAELENVTGGTTYSGSNYYELGLIDIADGQALGNHPVITTIGNYCDLSSTSCNNCPYFQLYISAFSGYCRARSFENDPCK